METQFEPVNLKRWEMPSSYFGEVWPDYFSAGVGQSRDSDCLERSNFTCMLRELGGEQETVIVVRESHWAVGWVEWIAIHATDSKALQVADSVQEGLKGYPVINEDHWSELEDVEAQEIWTQCYDAKERIKYIRENRGQFEFRDFSDLLGCVRGKWFGGYASELIGR